MICHRLSQGGRGGQKSPIFSSCIIWMTPYIKCTFAGLLGYSYILHFFNYWKILPCSLRFNWFWLGQMRSHKTKKLTNEAKTENKRSNKTENIVCLLGQVGKVSEFFLTIKTHLFNTDRVLTQINITLSVNSNYFNHQL